MFLTCQGRNHTPFFTEKHQLGTTKSVVPKLQEVAATTLPYMDNPGVKNVLLIIMFKKYVIPNKGPPA